MSQTATKTAVPDVTKHPQFIQMSQTVQALTAKNTILEREKYSAKIAGLVSTGRMSQKKADELLASVGTYQFSLTSTSTNIVKLDAQLDYAGSLPEGAIWSPDERIKQLSMTEHKRPSFFTESGSDMDPVELQEQLDKTFGSVARR